MINLNSVYDALPLEIDMNDRPIGNAEGMYCPTCKTETIQLLLTLNEYKWYCTKCDKRYSDLHDPKSFLNYNSWSFKL